MSSSVCSLPWLFRPSPVELALQYSIQRYGCGAYSTQLWSAVRCSSSLSKAYSCDVLKNAVSPGRVFMAIPDPSSQLIVSSGPEGSLQARSVVNHAGSRAYSGASMCQRWKRVLPAPKTSSLGGSAWKSLERPLIAMFFSP